MSEETWVGEPMTSPNYEYFNGVPARTLTAEEYASLPAEQQQNVDNSDMYTSVP